MSEDELIEPHYDVDHGETTERSFRRNLRLFLDDPRSNNYALSYFIFICSTIVVSSVMMIVETLPDYYGSRRTKWLWLEMLVVSVLTVDLSLHISSRTVSYKDLCKYLISWPFATALLSTAPFWIDISIGGKHFSDIQRLVVFRLFRLLRLVHMMAHSRLRKTLNALKQAIRQSLNVLLTILLLQFLLATVFATVIYLLERGEWQDGRWWIEPGKQASLFNSIPICYWYVYSIMSTVGLGDMVPVTAAGKLLTLPIMLTTILMLTLPSVVIANHFTRIYAD